MLNQNQAEVFYQEKKAGILSKTSRGYEFAYDSQYLSDPRALPICLTMPLREEKYESPDLFPFFKGLLPEGWLLALTSKTLKIDPNDKFNLLLHTGQNTVGAVHVRPIPSGDTYGSVHET